MTDTETAIPAATIILLRDEPTLEALMVQRHADIGFAGGALVFPGGRIDPGDGVAAWRDYADGLPEDPQMAAAMVAAIREAFEEAGILIARNGEAVIDDARIAALQSWRSRIEADDSLFLTFIREQKLRLACDALTYFAHWIAPPGLHKRFDTRFFAAIAPSDQAAREDGNEATEAIWISPSDALKARDAGERKLIFPTARNVELLGVSKTAAGVIRFAGERKIEQVQPWIAERGDERFLTIPDDLGYPVTEEPLTSAMRG